MHELNPFSGVHVSLVQYECDGFGDDGTFLQPPYPKGRFAYAANVAIILHHIDRALEVHVCASTAPSRCVLLANRAQATAIRSQAAHAGEHFGIPSTLL